MSAASTFHEEEVESEDGWSATVTITKKQATPCGTERVVGSQKYNFKKTPPGGETRQHRENRLRVKRKARQLALSYFDPEQHEKVKKKRRKAVRAQEAEPAAAVGIPEQVPAAGMQPTLAVVPEGAGASADDDGERARQRDWALLRALKAGVPPAATWQTLASSHLIDGMEWSVQDMMSRHAYVKECMSVVANLLGPELSGHKLAALHDVCS